MQSDPPALTSSSRVKEILQPIKVGPLPDGETALATSQLIRAAGDSLFFGGRPVDLALSPDGKTVYLKNMNSLLVVDVAAWGLLQELSFPGSGASMHGIAVSGDGSRVYVTGSNNELYEAAAA